MERGSQILRGGANFGAVAVATAVRIFSPSRRGGIAAFVPSDVDGDDETAADPTFTDRPPTEIYLEPHRQSRQTAEAPTMMMFGGSDMSQLHGTIRMMTTTMTRRTIIRMMTTTMTRSTMMVC